ncbi:SAD1 UNC-84 domain 1-like [Olea europaea subsp. europaea]|uniref:SAD1 UNC-84 domain 1-like n=1 Tax=Olea europaea subsp. europaea TaxID=158383 RepID=A0A8S0QEP7_OLEEU|nr:SAD1 UNC-84 domain 1-like [Olea europaea subsp. europaea]
MEFAWRRFLLTAGIMISDWSDWCTIRMVVRHSESFGKVTGSGSWLTNRNKVHADAAKMFRPSFGEPGQCFPLKGSNGFVQIKLRTAIIPEAVTLEHVFKRQAMKKCNWLQMGSRENDIWHVTFVGSVGLTFFGARHIYLDPYNQLLRLGGHLDVE